MLFITMMVSLELVSAQPSGRTFNTVTESLVEGKADQLADYFAQRVEISINGTTRVYNRSQARHVMRDFFQKYPPEGFSLRHRGSTGDTTFIIGRYRSRSGSFDVNIFMNNRSEEVVEIRFE
ncbi:MAG: DUF4783 domain-containing protein [Bacteroidota bacterium]